MSAVNLFSTKYHSGGHTSDNSLGAAMLNKPHVIDEILHTRGNKYNILLLTEGNGKTYSLKRTKDFPSLPNTTEVVGSKVVRWPLMGFKGKLTTVLTPPNHNGANNVPFLIELETDDFRPGDIINHPSGVQSRVYGEPSFNGRGYTYTSVIVDPRRLLRPLDDLAQNSMVAKGHNMFGARSQTGYSDQFYPEYHENYMTTIRKSLSIEGEALTNTTWLGTDNTKAGSKKEGVWFFEQENQAIEQLYKAREFCAVWGQSSVTPDGRQVALRDENGEAVWSGEGLWEQLRFSTRRLYTPGMMDVNFWTGLISDLNINSDSPTGKTYDFIGGYHFCEEASRAFQDYANGLGNMAPIVVDRKGDSLSINAQYVTSFQGILGARINIRPHWMFSDPTLWGHSSHPATGAPLMSYAGIALDTSNYGGYPNLMRFIKGNQTGNRGFIRMEVNGMVSVPGIKTPYASSGKDACEIHWLCQEMFALLNPYSSAIIEASIS